MMRQQLQQLSKSELIEAILQQQALELLTISAVSPSAPGHQPMRLSLYG